MTYGKSLVKSLALLGGMGLALTGMALPAEAQTYACPPGYYFLAGYGCYPFGGYTYYTPPPVYYAPPYPYYAPFGLSLQFGGRDHDGFRDRDRGGRFERGHR
jgi:hypothetical protein